MLADLGLPEPVLSVILAETDLYPDEQLGMIAQRLGFATSSSAVLDKLPRVDDADRDSRRTTSDDPRGASAAPRPPPTPDVPVGAVVFDADGRELAGPRTRGRRSAIRPRTPRSWRCARPPACTATGGGSRVRRWR